MADGIGKQRPEFRNIHISQISKYRLPAAGLMSIGHRVSGLGLFLFLPFLIYLLDLSIRSEVGFEQLQALTSNVVVKLVLVGLSWAFFHHFWAGLRHLSADLHIGMDKESGKSFAVGVFVLSLLCTLVAALKIFGVF